MRKLGKHYLAFLIDDRFVFVVCECFLPQRHKGTEAEYFIFELFFINMGRWWAMPILHLYYFLRVKAGFRQDMFIYSANNITFNLKYLFFRE